MKLLAIFFKNTIILNFKLISNWSN